MTSTNSSDATSWKVTNSLVYQLTTDRLPQNHSEVIVSMVNSSRSAQDCHALALKIGAFLNGAAAKPPIDWEPIRELWRKYDSIDWDILEAAVTSAVVGGA